MTLWEFSLSIYPKEGVADACLTLQNKHGFDVNLVLFCLWLARGQRALQPVRFAEVVALSTEWRERAITPLRRLRTEMKAWRSVGTLPAFSAREDFEALRNKIKTAELAAERSQQAVLMTLGTAEGLQDDHDLSLFAKQIMWLSTQQEESLNAGHLPVLTASEGLSAEQRDVAQLITHIANADSAELAAQVSASFAP